MILTHEAITRSRRNSDDAERSDGIPVVVKLLRPSSDEFRILKHLHSIKVLNNPAIPLIGTLEFNLAIKKQLPSGYL